MPEIHPAVATPRRMDVDHGSGERTAGAAAKTRDQIAADQIQFILRQDWFHPETLKKYIGALKNWQPNQLSVIIDGQIVSYNRVVGDLQQFLRSLPPDRRQNLAADGLAPDQLNLLESIIDEVSGSAASPETASPPPANIPPNLKELTQIYQSAIEAKAKRENLTKPQIDEYIAKQITPIIIQTGVVKQAAKIQLGLVIDNSQYLENLAAALGRKPEVVKRLAKMRLDQIADKTITTQALIQARSISLDTSQLAALFARNLEKELDFDDLLSTTIRTNEKDAKSAVESIKKTAAQETEKAKPAIEAAAKNLADHPATRKTAQTAAVAAVKQVEGDKKLKPTKAIRLTEALARHPDNPDRQERIIRSTLDATPAQAKIIRSQLAPQINQLAKSSAKPNYLAMADPDSIFNDISLHPNRFPQPLVDAVRSGRISDPDKLADAITVSRTLNIPLEAVVLSQWGIDAQKLAGRWRSGPKFLGFIPMGHGLDPKNATIAKLSDLAAAQKQLADSLKIPPPLLPPQIPQQFQKTAAQNSRAVRFSDFFQNNLNIFRLPSAISYNLGRFPPLGTLGNSGSAFISGLRVQSAPINSFFNFISSAGNAVRQAPSFLAAPFRAAGNAISNTIINPVKTWAGTQIKSGLAKAGAWLAKKGVTAAAKKIGMALIGKGAAALLAQAVPVAGQIAGVLMLLSTLGDIGKFIWANRKEIGFGLAGGFLLGQLLLGKLLGLLGSAAWTLGGAALGFALGGPIGAAIGGTLGYLIGSGALGSVLSGLGSALGSAAASLSSFIGALTAPSLVAGLGGTIATAGLLGVGAAWAIQTFFIQPNINSALFVPPDSGTFPPGGGPGGGPGGQYPTCWPSYGQISQGPFCSNGDPNLSHCDLKENAIDIAGGYGIPVYATHDGTATAYPEAGISCYGNFVIIVSPFGFKTYYAHLTDITFSDSIEVNAGTQIGTQGDSTAPGCYFTGPHVHYELRPSSPNIDETVPPYTTGGITEGCFAKDSGGGTTPLPTPGGPKPTPGLAKTCEYFGGTCTNSCIDQCTIEKPFYEFSNCQVPPNVCCSNTRPGCTSSTPGPGESGLIISGIVNIPLGGDFCLANVNRIIIKIDERHPEAPPGQKLKAVDKIVVESPPPPAARIPFTFNNLKANQEYYVSAAAVLVSGANYGGTNAATSTTAPNTSVNLTNDVCTKNL